MNIFYLSENPIEAARFHCDKHVVKMILETAQLLCTAHRIIDGDELGDLNGLYKTAFPNHPCAVWVRQSVENYNWTFALFVALLAQYRVRYDKKHACEKLLVALSFVPEGIAEESFTEPPQCMPEEYKGDDVISAYRLYYNCDKSRFAAWKNGGVPWWFSNLMIA